MDIPTEEELFNIIMHTSTTVWQHELGKSNLENWLSNFTGAVFEIQKERQFALWLLSHFTYYNQDEVKHLCKVLYKDLLHHVLTNGNSGKPISETVDTFFEKTNIVPAERVSGSSGFIAYFFRHTNSLPMTLFNFSIENVSEKIENIIIIDDVTLTGDNDSQMHKFFEKHISKYPLKKFFLLTLISSESSVKFLSETFENLAIISAITLDSRDKCFSSESDVFSQFPELREECQKFAEHYGKKIPIVEPLGFKNGQYTFGFFYNTPDNALPIFWGQVNGWKPIIKRFHKNYKDRKYLGNERFL